MTSNLKLLLYQIIVLIGLIFSNHLLACSPSEASPSQFKLDINIIVKSKDLENQDELDSQLNAVLKNQKYRNQQNKDRNKKPYHQCDCCEYCHCYICINCIVFASAILALPQIDKFDGSVAGRIKSIEKFYLSLFSTPLEHPPRLTAYFLA